MPFQITQTNSICASLVQIALALALLPLAIYAANNLPSFKVPEPPPVAEAPRSTSAGIEPAPNYWQRIHHQTQNLRHRPWLPAILLSLLKAIRPVPATIEPALPEAQLVALTALMSAATHFGFNKALTEKVEMDMAFTLADIAQVFPDPSLFTDPRAMEYADLKAQIAHCLQTLQANPVRLPPGALKQFIAIAKEFTITQKTIGT